MKKYILSLLWVLLMLVSCGKKSVDKNDQLRQQQEEAPINFPDLIAKQKVICDDFNECPEFIAKIVVIEASKIKFCTGTLISKNEIVTSAQCVGRSMRAPHLRCDESVFFSFPRTPFRESQKVGCERVVYADQNISKDPALWENDIIVFKLDANVQRRTPKLNFGGIKDGKETYAWKIDYQDEANGILKKVDCSTVGNNFLYPYNSTSFPPMMISTECSLDREGNLGAPLFSGKRLLSVYSAKEKERILNYLRAKKVIDFKQNDFFYMSHMACSKYMQNLGRRNPRGCETNVSISELDELRSRILRSIDIHDDSIDKLIAELEKPNRYFLWKAEFRENDVNKTFEIHMKRPKCIYRSSDWIYEFKPSRRRIYTYGKITIEWPNYVLKTKLNRKLIPYSNMTTASDPKVFTIEINPFNAHVNGVTDAKISSTLGTIPTTEEHLEIQSCSN